MCDDNKNTPRSSSSLRRSTPSQINSLGSVPKFPKLSTDISPSRDPFLGTNSGLTPIRHPQQLPQQLTPHSQHQMLSELMQKKIELESGQISMEKRIKSLETALREQEKRTFELEKDRKLLLLEAEGKEEKIKELSLKYEKNINEKETSICKLQTELSTKIESLVETQQRLREITKKCRQFENEISKNEMIDDSNEKQSISSKKNTIEKEYKELAEQYSILNRKYEELLQIQRNNEQTKGKFIIYPKQHNIQMNARKRIQNLSLRTASITLCISNQD